MIFGVDDIHALRVKLAEQREAMSKDEAEREFKARVERGRQAIAEIRKNKPVTQPMSAQR